MRAYPAQLAVLWRYCSFYPRSHADRIKHTSLLGKPRLHDVRYGVGQLDCTALALFVRIVSVCQLLILVTPGRFELPTRSLGNCCSIHLSYGATSL